MDKIFIEQAKNIRREYIRNAKEIVKREDIIDGYRQELTKVQEELTDKINEQTLVEKLILIEKNIKGIEKILEPYTSKMKQLEKEADKLFENIKERHKTLTPEDIKNELIPYLAEIKF